MRVGSFDGSQRFLHNRLFGATDEKTNSRKSYCKVKAFRHLQHRGLDSIEAQCGKNNFTCS